MARGHPPEWLETKRVDHAGDEGQNHTHDWEFGPPDPETTPPEYPRICADCGRVEIQQIEDSEPRSYQALYEQHHGGE